ncbi:hypothetical protein C206_01307 [Pseudomonas putida TRO1]|uniref:Uncharacterized protein n=1 Tax=Pseudomonas putida TRO1 TaxID=1227924 RepID=A0AAD2WF38_PSEPU|nr:hypothetical protein C206_01307 [Pseudomonas putida TRO1]
MRVVGWLLTALGWAGLVVALVMIAIAVMGDIANPGQTFVTALVCVALSGTLIMLGRRFKVRSKPLLPILLAS